MTSTTAMAGLTEASSRLQPALPRCFFIAVGPPQNTVTLHFAALAKELARRGHRVVLLGKARSSRPDDHHGNPGFWTWPSRRGTSLRDARFFYQLVRQYRPHCVVGNFGAVNITTLVGALCRVPVRMCWVHTPTEAIAIDRGGMQIKQRFQNARRSWVLRFATHVVANSRATAEDVREGCGGSDRRCQVRYLSLADPIAGIEPGGAPKANDLVLCAGRLIPCKGQDVLLRAAAVLKERGMRFKVALVGEGASLEALQRLAVDLQLERDCQFLGCLKHEEVLQRMAGATLTVVPSRSEGFGLVCVESLAVGTPVVASRVGGIPDILSDGREGFLVPRNDPETLADRLGRLLADPLLRRRMGERARQRFLSTFEQGRIVPQQADWLEAVVPAK